MDIVGDNWDAAIFERLAVNPPPSSDRHEDGYDHVLRILLDTAGKSVTNYIGATLPDVTAVLGRTADDPAHLMIDALTEYYLQMHEVLANGGPARVPGWESAVTALRSALSGNNTPRVIVTFQIGFPLLVPMAVNAALEEPVCVLVHKQNRFAVDLFERELSGGEAIYLEDVDAFRLALALGGGANLIANIDTAYPGSRSAEIAVLERHLSVPTGLLLLARRKRIPVQCIALVRQGDRLEALAGPELPARDLSDSMLLDRIAVFFDDAIRRFPLQWFGWSGLH
jgi:hypothetical protein